MIGTLANAIVIVIYVYMSIISQKKRKSCLH